MTDQPYADMPQEQHKLPDGKMRRLLAMVRRRAERATPGPWGHSVFDVYVAGTDDGQGHAENLFEASGDNAESNAVFVAHAREDIPALIAEVERQHAKREALRYALTELKDAFVFGIDDVTLESARRQAFWVLTKDDEE
jgi:hypothetical protein